MQAFIYSRSQPLRTNPKLHPWRLIYSFQIFEAKGNGIDEVCNYSSKRRGDSCTRAQISTAAAEGEAWSGGQRREYHVGVEGGAGGGVVQIAHIQPTSSIHTKPVIPFSPKRVLFDIVLLFD